jgi:hypothetical protein
MFERNNTRRAADSIWKRHKVVEVGEALRLAASCRTPAPIRHAVIDLYPESPFMGSHGLHSAAQQQRAGADGRKSAIEAYGGPMEMPDS